MQVKEGYRHSNKNDASCQIVHYYGRVNAISLRLLTLRALLAEKLEGALMKDADNRFLDKKCQPRHAFQLTETDGTRPRKLLRGRYKNVNDF